MDDVPSHVLKMAKGQAKHMKHKLNEAEANEAERSRREKLAVGLPERAQREAAMERLERERATERLAITRMREEHAMLLGAAMRGGAPEQPRPRPHKDVFRPHDAAHPLAASGPPPRDKPGTTAQSLAMLKESLKKEEARAAAAAGGARGGGRRTSGPGRPRNMHDRTALLAQRQAILDRISQLDNLGSGRLGFTGRSDLSAGSGYSRGGLGGPPMSARSDLSRISTASGATFCDLEAPVRWKNNLPSTVPPLAMPSA